ncbi:FAD/NAD(P)-binding protein [Mycobacterium sp. SMC-4]|uniref:FAD/NAD(P)-binding protein n=1 Tax=Mycobacterium sp. SMC-4 TaxID=2857059 RepID=UPI0021B392A3|nr:FAD/NAD(P)-binding protein [Mycobacterium sp. SMC-4]UXA17333.1 FAD/NAD(P)-binding protein [Mycobacterium sp. SMC-4]
MTLAVPTGRTAHADTMLPHRVVGRVVHTADTVTLLLEPTRQPTPPFQAGQFMMLYRHGVGEIAISISGIRADDGLLEHTIRAVGAVSRALHDTPVGELIGVRGPFGTSWQPESVTGRDLVIVAGGVGLAPLRPMVLSALRARADYRRIVLITGARSPADILFRNDQTRWATTGLELHQTVDQPTPEWPGSVGFVTEPLARVSLDPVRTTAFLCGPEPMMQFCARTLIAKTVAPEDILISLERNMQCGVERCGHCQLGPLLLCRDGPIVDYATAQPLLSVAGL